MGRLYHFACPGCGYEAEVCGGFDRGMLSADHTVSCPRCRELSDLEIWDDSRPDFQELALLDEDADFRADWLRRQVRVRCGLDRRHAARLWNHPGLCPRCGKTLTRQFTGLMWD